MKIRLNGKWEEVPEPLSLGDLIRRQGIPPYYAAAVNGDFVPRSQHDTTMLADGDEVEIVGPVQGG